MKSLGIVLCLVLTAVFAVTAAGRDKAELSFPALDGRVHKLSDYRGKWVLVNYWATWCPPCLEEMPELEMFYNNNSARAVVLGVNMEDVGKEQLRRFVEEQFLSYPILLATAEPTQSIGSIPGLPTSFLVNPDGEVVARQVGPITAEAIERYIDRYEARQSK